MLHLFVLLIAALVGLNAGGRRPMRRIRFRFYNLAPVNSRPDPLNRGDAWFIRRELRAIANLNPRTGKRIRFARRPHVIGVCEAIGRDLPQLTGYRLIRDRSTPSRANVALYVLEWLDVESVDWVDLTAQWPRPKHPGLHEPRSILVVVIAGWIVIVWHAPQPLGGHLVARVNQALATARGEILAAMVDLMTRGRPVLALSDPNALDDDLVRELGDASNATAVKCGTGFEAGHAVGATFEFVATPGRAHGVRMLSDHRKYLRGRATTRR